MSEGDHVVINDPSYPEGVGTVTRVGGHLGPDEVEVLFRDWGTYRVDVASCRKVVPPLKRFLVFAGERWCPLGGWKDLVGSFDDLVEARQSARDKIDGGGYGHPPIWAHVVDTLTGEIIQCH